MTDRDDEIRRAEELRARQKGRNLVLGLVLAGLVVLFFALTIVRFPTS